MPEEFHSSHPLLVMGEGMGLSHFSEDLYSRNLGQFRILDGNWFFGWGDFFQVGLENSLYM